MKRLVFMTSTGATVYRVNETTYTVGKKGDYAKVIAALKEDLQSSNFMDRLNAQLLWQELKNNTLITLEN